MATDRRDARSAGLLLPAAGSARRVTGTGGTSRYHTARAAGDTCHSCRLQRIERVHSAARTPSRQSCAYRFFSFSTDINNEKTHPLSPCPEGAPSPAAQQHGCEHQARGRSPASGDGCRAAGTARPGETRRSGPHLKSLSVEVIFSSKLEIWYDTLAMAAGRDGAGRPREDGGGQRGRALPAGPPPRRRDGPRGGRREGAPPTQPAPGSGAGPRAAPAGAAARRAARRAARVGGGQRGGSRRSIAPRSGRHRPPATRTAAPRGTEWSAAQQHGTARRRLPPPARGAGRNWARAEPPARAAPRRGPFGRRTAVPRLSRAAARRPIAARRSTARSRRHGRPEEDGGAEPSSAGRGGLSGYSGRRQKKVPVLALRPAGPGEALRSPGRPYVRSRALAPGPCVVRCFLTSPPSLLPQVSVINTVDTSHEDMIVSVRGTAAVQPRKTRLSAVRVLCRVVPTLLRGALVWGSESTVRVSAWKVNVGREISNRDNNLDSAIS